MTLDSISVISNGLVNFQVRISEGGGNKTSGHSGAELMRSNHYCCGSGTHQVPVGLTLMPGTYLHQYGLLGWNDGSTCTVQRQVEHTPTRSRRGLLTLYSLAHHEQVVFTTPTSGLFLKVV